MIPSASSPSLSSSAEHNMPLDTTPRILDFFNLSPLGNLTPGTASGLFMPATTLGAPQTTSTGSPCPVITRQTLSRSALGCLPTSTTSAMTTPSSPSPSVCTPSTSSPAIVSLSVSAVVSRSGSIQSRNQDSAILMGLTGTGARNAGRCRKTYAGPSRHNATSPSVRYPCRRHNP